MKEKSITPSCILQKLENLENELREVREYLSQYLSAAVSQSDGTPDVEWQYTLIDLYEALGSKKHYAVRLRTALEKQGINSLGEFLSLTPGQLLDLENVGPGTLLQVKKALNKLGVTW